MMNARHSGRGGWVFLTAILLALLTTTGLAADRDRTPRIIQSDDYWHFNSVGNLGLTVTNFGILGQGYNNENQPSCMYKLRTNLPKEQVEHFSYAGIWIGGQKNGQNYVSTAIYDGVFGPEDGGWEFTTSAQSTIKDSPIFRHLASEDRRFDLSHADDPVDPYISFAGVLEAPLENGYWQMGTTTWDTMVTRSNIVDASGSNQYKEYAKFYDPTAISGQDLYAAFTDTNTVVPGTGQSIPNHSPLGIHVALEAYSWKEPFADSFVILNYRITNVPEGYRIAQDDETVNYGDGVERDFAAGDTIWTGDPIIAPYFGMWVDASVGNMNYTDIYSSQGGPGGRWDWYDNMNNYNPSRALCMQYDFDGDAGWAQSYLGIKVLGGEPLDADSLPGNYDAYYHQWTWQGSQYSGDFPMPQDEDERYQFMGQHINYANIPTTEDYLASWMMLLSTGPFPDLAPGERFTVAYATLAGLWNGSGGDSQERRSNLYLNAEWAQIAYNGEDRNGNGILDPGEDNDGDGKITRYILPGAPPSPSLAVMPGDREVTLYWNDTPESAIDPISNKIDFEGYRIYSSPKTLNDSLSTEWTMLAQYDVNYDVDPTDDDSTLIGYNLGVNAIHLDSLVLEGVYTQSQVDSIRDLVEDEYGFRPDYRWVNFDVQNGWPRSLYYSVTSYDRGDPDNNLESLESSRDENRTFAYPGTAPTGAGDMRVGVYPNPYRGRAAWDGLSEDERLVWFRYLPANARVTIFNVAGERIDRFEHHAATYTGADVPRITNAELTGEQRVFAGGEHAWDLLTENGQEVATGLYIFVVEDLDHGDKKTGKFLIIK